MAMSAEDIVTIISAVTISVTTVLGTLATLYTTLRVKTRVRDLQGLNERMEKQNARLEAAAEAQAVKMSKIELATNGMKDELVSATKAAAHAEGRASALSESKGDV